MTWPLIRKLLRDLRVALIVVALLLGGFQCLWVRITARILGELQPYFTQLASFGGKTSRDVEDEVFKGPGKIIRNLIGGERVNLDKAMDMLSIGYVHPLMQTIFCIWAIGRASGAIAGELDRGTMELLLAQPLPRHRLVLAHFCVDAITIPLLCFSLWAGTWLGTQIVGPIVPEPTDFKPPDAFYNVELGPLKWSVRAALPIPQESEEDQRERLAIHPAEFGPALWVVGGLIFSVGGVTMWLSAAGRSRWRVMGWAVLLTLIQFLVNLLGQMWEPLKPFRPFTIFYYYQPQQVILGKPWTVPLFEGSGGEALWHVPMLPVLFGVGLIGYAMALWTFCKRDLPAPL
jgi:ABC-2 type transport system permease protein